MIKLKKQSIKFSKTLFSGERGTPLGYVVWEKAWQTYSTKLRVTYFCRHMTNYWTEILSEKQFCPCYALEKAARTGKHMLNWEHTHFMSFPQRVQNIFLTPKQSLLLTNRSENAYKH